MIFLLCL